MLIPSLHLIGSRTLGGAERWFIRFVNALADSGQPVAAGIRKGSALTGQINARVVTQALPMKTVWDPWSRHAVNRMIDKHQPRIVQTYMGRATRLTRLPPKRGMVHVARLGGYYKLDGYRHAHAWITNTLGLQRHLLEAGFPEERVFTIYNFVDEAPPSPATAALARLRGSLEIPDDAWVLMTPGRFVPVKGHASLLNAFASLPTEVAGRPLYLVLVGDGPLQAELHKQTLQLGIDGRVRWVGWQLEPSPYYYLADLVVFPSRDEETFGNVILETWAHERPLLVTAFRGARELTSHGIDTWQVPCGDAEALAQGISLLLEDYALAMGLAEQGQREVKWRFSRDVVLEAYREVYGTLLFAMR